MSHRLILLADGGSTKVHWQLRLGTEIIHEFRSPGVNPAVMGADEVEGLLRMALREELPRLQSVGHPLTEVRYYGAGCKDASTCGAVETAIRKELGADAVTVTVGSDMLGTCASLLDMRPGIGCILGTGANSCLYDGKRIIANTPPLGYILGDEGSGTWLGKRLLSDRFKGLLPPALQTAFDRTYPDVTECDVIKRVYRPTPTDGAPNRFLASLTPFISSHINEEAMQRLVMDGFDAFIDRNVMRYFSADLMAQSGVRDRSELEICFTGSIAYVFRDLLRVSVINHGLTPGLILQSPLQ